MLFGNKTEVIEEFTIMKKRGNAAEHLQNSCSAGSSWRFILFK